MGLAARKDIERFTYGDYLKWDDGERWELIDGEPYNMTPAPLRVHQDILGNLHWKLREQLEGKPCKVYLAPFDVRLPLGAEKEEDITNVVQPDISVICDLEKLDAKGCIGAPDLIIEILSPGNRKRDRMEKFNLYERAGVREYWMVWPEELMVEVFLLGVDGSYGRPGMYTEKDTVEIRVLKDMRIDLSQIFESTGEKALSKGPPNTVDLSKKDKRKL
ncbi:MAG: Uma2 family endonuclease [bacterium]|nr:Uma2 family endonuclease [bacterium]